MNMAPHSNLSAEIHRLILYFDSLPKDVQKEVIMYLKSSGPGLNLNTRYIRKKITGSQTVGTINVLVE